jgi:hypothetical protein
VVKEKGERIKKFNEERAEQVDEKFKLGDIVFLKNLFLKNSKGGKQIEDS